MIDNALGDLQFSCAIAYIDDILVHSPSLEQQAINLEAVMAAFHKAGLFLKASKCEFYKEEVTFLRNLVLKEAVVIPPNKLDAIREWPTPTTHKQL